MEKLTEKIEFPSGVFVPDTEGDVDIFDDVYGKTRREVIGWWHPTTGRARKVWRDLQTTSTFDVQGQIRVERIGKGASLEEALGLVKKEAAPTPAPTPKGGIRPDMDVSRPDFRDDEFDEDAAVLVD